MEKKFTAENFAFDDSEDSPKTEKEEPKKVEKENPKRKSQDKKSPRKEPDWAKAIREISIDWNPNSRKSQEKSPREQQILKEHGYEELGLGDVSLKGEALKGTFFQMKKILLDKRNIPVLECPENHTQCPNCGIVYMYAKPPKEGTPTEKEQHMSGICSDKCWNEFIGPEPQNEQEVKIFLEKYQDENQYITMTRATEKAIIFNYK